MKRAVWVRSPPKGWVRGSETQVESPETSESTSTVRPVRDVGVVLYSALGVQGLGEGRSGTVHKIGTSRQVGRRVRCRKESDG